MIKGTSTKDKIFINIFTQHQTTYMYKANTGRTEGRNGQQYGSSKKLPTPLSITDRTSRQNINKDRGLD